MPQKISPRQNQVLNLVRDRFDGEMDASPENYRQIADEIGWKNYGGVQDCLFALRAKGAVWSVGSIAFPTKWIAKDAQANL